MDQILDVLSGLAALDFSRRVETQGDSGKVDATTAAALFASGRGGLLDAYEVSQAVNRADNDNPTLIEPISSQSAAAEAEASARAPSKREKWRYRGAS